MKTQHHFLLLLPLFFLSTHLTDAAPMGVCYGRVANNLPSPATVMNILQTNRISRARVFDTDPNTLRSFAGTGIELMIDIPNEALPSLAIGTPSSALTYLQSNIFIHISPTQIRYIAAGNEIFMKDAFYTPHLLPALQKLYQALTILNLQNTIKLSTPHAASVLSSSDPPSAGAFNPNLLKFMIPLLIFLQNTNSVLMVNVYPYLSYAGDSDHVPIDYALFRSENVVRDGEFTYTNMFDASVDAFVYAMEKVGYCGVTVVVSETGWPTASGVGANKENAWGYNSNVVKRGGFCYSNLLKQIKCNNNPLIQKFVKITLSVN